MSAVIDVEFALQTWGSIAESLHAAGVANDLPTADAVADDHDDGLREECAFIQ